MKKIEDINRAFINNTKIANELRKSKNINTNGFYRIDVGEKGKAVEVLYSIDTRLTYFDLAVADAVYTLWKNGFDKIAITQVMRVLSGNEEQVLTAPKKKEIESSIEKMSKTLFKINWAKEKDARGITRGSYEEEFARSFLPCKKIGTKYYLTEKMPLYEYGEMNGQMISFPLSLLKTFEKGSGQSKSDTTELVLIKRFLVQRIEVLQHKNRFNENKIVYLRRAHGGSEKYVGLLPLLDILPTNYIDGDEAYGEQKKRRIIDRVHKSVCDILDNFVKQNYIKGYAIEKDGGRVYGVMLEVESDNEVIDHVVD